MIKVNTYIIVSKIIKLKYEKSKKLFCQLHNLITKHDHQQHIAYMLIITFDTLSSREIFRIDVRTIY